MTQPTQIKERDIFRWKYADEKPEDLDAWKRYHCKSQFAIAQDGYLTDTYWHGGSSHSSRWTYEEACEKLVLEFLGNFDNLERRDEYAGEHYDDAEIVNLNHSNSSRGNFFIRKGAKMSAAKMGKVIEDKLNKAYRDKESAEWSIRQLEGSLKQITDGTADLNKIYI